MEHDEFYNHSWEICDQALANIRAKEMIPLPKNYQNEFDALLEMKTCDELTCAAYREEGVTASDVNKYLEIAKLALEAFVQSNKEITHVISEHAGRMGGPSHPYSESYIAENCHRIVDNLARLDTEMSNALLKAHEKIQKLSDKLEHLTEENRIDNLTKFYNRKELFKDLMNISSNLHTQERTVECYLLMIDLDDFKGINDMYSHLAGDKTLIFIAKTISSLIRNTDKAYRFGGDEFIIVLNRATFEVANTIAEKIRSNIEKARLFYENNEIHVTVSIGITRLNEEEFEKSLLKADRALYEAKKNCKNQVYMVEGE